MQPERKQGNQNAVNLAVDLVIFLIFLVVEVPRFSGLPIHSTSGSASRLARVRSRMCCCTGRGLSRSQSASLARLR